MSRPPASVRAARLLAGVFFFAFLAAVTWPGFLPFNRVRPFVLGLPFSLFWVAAWVAAGCVVLWILDAAERKGR